MLQNLWGAVPLVPAVPADPLYVGEAAGRRPKTSSPTFQPAISERETKGGIVPPDNCIDVTPSSSAMSS